MSKPIEPPARLSRGFTTLELLGVLMVIAILAAAVAPNVIGLLKSQKIRSEQEAVQAAGSALRTGIIRSQRLPLDDTIAAPTDPQADWAELAELGGGGGRQGILRQVVDNDGKLVSARRLFLARPRHGWRGATFNEITGDGTQAGWLPGGQTGLRLILLGTGDRLLPLPETLSDAAFDWLWDEFTPASASDAVSAKLGDHGFDPKWSGRRSFDLAIARIDLRDLVVPVTLEARRRLTLESPPLELDFAGRPGGPPSFTLTIRGASGVSFSYNTLGDTASGFKLQLQLVHPGELDRVVSEDLSEIPPDQKKVVITAVASSGAAASHELPVPSLERPVYELAASVGSSTPYSLQNEQTDLLLMRGQEVGLRSHSVDGGQLVRTFVVELPFRHFYFNGTSWSQR